MQATKQILIIDFWNLLCSWMCKTPKSHCKTLELPPVSNLVFAPYVFIELPVGSSKFWQWDLGILHIKELCQIISEVYDQYLLCCLHFSICSLCVCWAPCRELQKGTPFLSNGIWASYTFRSYAKKFQKSLINICFVACILVFAPYVYVELPVGSFRRELHFWAMGFGHLTHSGAMPKNFRSLRSIFALLLAF